LLEHGETFLMIVVKVWPTRPRRQATAVKVCGGEGTEVSSKKDFAIAVPKPGEIVAAHASSRRLP